MKRLFFFAVMTCFFGCGKSEPDPPQACLDFIDAAALSISKCGVDIDVARGQFESALGGCSTFTDIRDEDQLYQDCIPEVKGITCDQWNGATSPLPSACVSQFIR